MRLNHDVIVKRVEDTVFLVPVGAKTFKGLARSNKTAGYILECLKNDTTKEKITDAVAEKYDASRETIDADVEEFLAKLRKLNALEE